MIDAVLMVTVVAFAISLRWIPHLISPKGVGVDHWYWKSYIDAYKRHRKFPPDMPQYLLEEKQWYPPLFPVLMAILPTTLFARYSRHIALILDLVRMFLLGATTTMLTGELRAGILASAIYAVSPIVVAYNVQLNPRGLGALFLDLVILVLIWLKVAEGPALVWFVVVAISGLILLVHKMTTQLFWFGCLALSAIMRDWTLLALIPASIMFATVISGGFYLKVLAGHWDIVTFWNRNWQWLTAHPIRESPIYSETNYATPTKYFRSGFIGFSRRARYLVGANPWSWLALALLTWGVPIFENLPILAVEWLAAYLAFSLAFALATTMIPWVRCLGNGYLYLYNTAFPAAFFCAAFAMGASAESPTFLISIATTVIVALLTIVTFYRATRGSKTFRIEGDLEKAVDYLAHQSPGSVLCLPLHWSDYVSYKTGKPVLYGAHGYGFKLIEKLFPRLMIPINDLLNQYQVRYLVTLEGYLPPNFLAELPQSQRICFGEYQLFSFQRNLNTVSRISTSTGSHP